MSRRPPTKEELEQEQRRVDRIFAGLPPDDESEKPHAGNGANSEDKKEEKSKEPKQADILVAEAKTAILFHTPDGEEFADVVIGVCRETHRIRGSKFRQWLRHQYFLKKGSGCSSEALQTAIETVAAFAQFEGEERDAHCRIAEHQGSIFIDIGDKTWRAIEVTERGWKVVDDPPVRFRRSASTKALPMPQTGDIKLLKPLCNVKDEEFVLIVAYMLAALRPNANYPVLVITGEQGAAKSSLVSTVVRLTDPRVPEQRTLPRSEDDLIVAAKGAHLLAYDNISGMPDWLSDGICRLSTGGGAGKRRLYSDDDEVLFAGRRAVVVNGIEDTATRADLVDRAVMLTLEPIAENKRRQASEIAADLEAKAPKIFGALLDGLVAGLRNLAKVTMPDKPRMADFALWAEAATRAYWPAGTFLTAYRACLANSVELVLEASPVGSAVRAFMVAREEYQGSATDLLAQLSAMIGEPANREQAWPKRPNTLVGKLRRAAPALRKIGISITFGRRGHGGPKSITIKARSQPEEKGKTSTPSTPSSPKDEKPSMNNGGRHIDGVDPVTMGDDPVTINAAKIDTTNSLKNKPGVDGDDGDDLLHLSAVGEVGTVNGLGLEPVPIRVRIEEIRHPAISAGPDDDLADFR